MKKIIPIVTLLSTSALIVGLTLTPAEEKNENYINNINAFKNEVTKYASVNNVDLTNTALNKYVLSLEDNFDETLTQVSPINQEITENNTENQVETEQNEVNLEETEISLDEKEDEIIETPIQPDQVSTLYSLSNDIENSCDDKVINIRNSNR